MNNNPNTIVKQDFAVVKQVDGRVAHMTNTTWHQSWQRNPSGPPPNQITMDPSAKYMTEKHSEDIYISFIFYCIGSFQKTSIPPPRRKLEVNPPTPFECPNAFTIIRNNFFSPPPPDGRNFLWGECGSFLERPIEYNQYFDNTC